MEMRLRAPVTRGYFFLLGASLTRLRREISIRKKYPLEPGQGKAKYAVKTLSNKHKPESAYTRLAY